MLLKTILFSGLMFFIGCSTTVRQLQPGRYSATYPGVNTMESELIAIKLEDYQSALADRERTRVRIVESVVKNGDRYFRIFDVNPRGPYGMLGIKNGDIILAANDIIFVDKEGILRFPPLFLIDKSVEIIVGRSGVNKRIIAKVG